MNMYCQVKIKETFEKMYYFTFDRWEEFLEGRMGTSWQVRAKESSPVEPHR